MKYDIHLLIDRFMSQVHKANDRQCSQFIYAAHQLGWNDPNTYTAVLNQLGGLESEVPQVYSIALWASSYRVLKPPSVVKVLLNSFVLCLENAKVQEMSNVLLAIQRWYDKTDAVSMLSADDVKGIKMIVQQVCLAIAEKITFVDQN